MNQENELPHATSDEIQDAVNDALLRLSGTRQVTVATVVGVLTCIADVQRHAFVSDQIEPKIHATFQIPIPVFEPDEGEDGGGTLQ